MVDGDDSGYVARGFVNLPIGENAALRFVGWGVSDAGWVDNKPATRTYTGDVSTPADDITVNNDQFVEKNYNTVETAGARAALRINLNENWTVTPQLMYQRQDQQGSWGDDLNDVLATGDYAVAHFRQEYTDDEWWQGGLTIEGNVANFEVVYAGNYLDRAVDGAFDYSDYSYWYDQTYTSGFFLQLFANNAGTSTPFLERTAADLVSNPDAAFNNDDNYTKVSHELRVSTPQDKRVRGLLGFFYQKQYHDFYQEFGRLDGLARSMTPNGQDPGAPPYLGVVYLNSMDRTDRDQAVFGQVAFDITDALELSLGARYFEPEVHVKGFFGFGIGFTQLGWSGTGEKPVQRDRRRPGRPEGRALRERRQDNQGKRQRVPRQPLVEGHGFRDAVRDLVRGLPAGRHQPQSVRGRLHPGHPARTTRSAGRPASRTIACSLNGAIFLEDWDDIQVSFQGANGITQVANGGKAQVKGIEAQLDWLPTDNLRLGLAVAYYDSELKKDFCDLDNDDFDQDGDITECAFDEDTGEVLIKAPKGTALPLTPEFKGNLIARYSFPMGGFNAYTQGTFNYQTDASSELELADNAAYGDIPSSTFINLAFGTEWDKNTVELFISNVTGEDAPLGVTSECTPQVCGVQARA
jgi:hypothetical protein